MSTLSLPRPKASVSTLLARFPKRYLAQLPGAYRLWRRFPIGSVHARTRWDIWDRPQYAYGVYSAVELARALGIDAITAIEFGVARGEGLLALESICAEIGPALGVRIRVVGFDSGQMLALESICAEIGPALGVRIRVVGFDSGRGQPKPLDHRDLPYLWDEGFYAMDEAALRPRLRSAELIIGDVGDTVGEFVRSAPDPIGFISFDLDYYSSTVKAFGIFDGAPMTRLPRVHCYFDDIVWPEYACYNEFTGEYLAIREFNERHPSRKIAKLEHLRLMRQRPAGWNEQIYVCHDFEHPRYAVNIKRGRPPGPNEMPI